MTNHDRKGGSTMSRATQQVTAIREWIDQMEKEAKAARESGTLAGSSSAMVAETFIAELRARLNVEDRPRTVREIIDDVLADRTATHDIVSYAIREAVRDRRDGNWTVDRTVESAVGLFEVVQPYIYDADGVLDEPATDPMNPEED